MVTVGAAILDIFMKSDKFQVVKSDKVPGGVAMCEVYGGKMEVEEVVMTSGGGGTNTAVGFARKELKTTCVVEMGNDPQSLIVHRDLESSGVDTRHVVQEPDETTAVSVILIAEDGGRSIMVHRGASAMLTKSDLPLKNLETRWLHVTSLGGNLGVLETLLKWAKEHKVRVSLNPGMKEIQKKKKLLKMLSMVEVLFVNREEAGELWGEDYQKDEVWQAKHCPIGPRVSLITDGERGGKMCQEGKCEFWKGTKVKSVTDTTGAGDAFASGYVAALLYGHNYEKALEWGQKQAVSVIKKIGAKEGLLSLAEING